MLKQTKLVSFLDAAGGIAGASLVLAAVLVFVATGEATNKMLYVSIALLLLAAGLTLMFVRRLTIVRVVLGSFFLLVFVASLVAAVFLPGGIR